ncbi:hypothetical protein KAR91_03630 [Candidatus Pacearchaeota archaeon]|nr:hypothetical protein [Candidatus Pacearchaeota archaeon]
MDANKIKQLKSCRTPTEAAPIMETLRLRPSQKKLVETALQLQHSQDPRQRAFGEDYFATAIREAEDDEKLKEEHKDQANIGDVGNDRDSVDKKVSEADEITGALDSHQSSDIDMPYPAEGSDAPQSDIESSKTAQGENQMREMPMGGGMPGMQMPPPPMPQQQAGGMPPLDPALMQGMKPQLPPGLNPAMMKQMQYTVQEAMKTYVRPIVKEVKKLREAYIAVDKKIQETEALRGGMKLDLDAIKKASPVHVRETISDLDIPVPTVEHTRFDLEAAHNDILAMDKAISNKRSDIYG